MADNYRIAMGKFGLDLDDGEVRLEESIPLANDVLAEITRMLEEHKEVIVEKGRSHPISLELRLAWLFITVFSYSVYNDHFVVPACEYPTPQFAPLVYLFLPLLTIMVFLQDARSRNLT